MKNESFENWVKRLIEDYKSYNITKSEVYEILFDVQLSETEARKRLYGIRDYIENQDENTPIEHKIATKIEHSINTDGSQSDERVIKAIAEYQMKDERYLLTAHGYDPAFWSLTSARSSMWDQKEDVTLYYSRINIKPKFNPITQNNIDEIFENIKMPIADVESRKYKSEDLMLEVNLRDCHIGKFSWEGETGENYDYKIATKRILSAISQLKNNIQSQKFEKVVLCMSDDFFHFDDMQGSTTKGTKLDTDLRWQKMFLKGTELIIRVINELKDIAPVDYIYVPGNHDSQVSFYATCYVAKHFEQNKNIKVDISPKTRKYVKFGNCLVGFAHGDSEKKRIDGIMQVEVPKEWGETRFREFHLGHLHSEQVRELNGLKIRNIPSLTATDAWHKQSGFIGAIPISQCFIWHKKYGNINIMNIPLVQSEESNRSN